jgi:hypothetical protein
MNTPRTIGLRVGEVRVMVSFVLDRMGVMTVSAQLWDSTRYADGTVVYNEKLSPARNGIAALEAAIRNKSIFPTSEQVEICKAYAAETGIEVA